MPRPSIELRRFAWARRRGDGEGDPLPSHRKPAYMSAMPPRAPSAARPPLAALRGVALQDGAVRLFDGVDLALEPRARACLVGRNGAGKSTLLRLLAGRIAADEGDRFVQPGSRFAYVPQEPVIEGSTVRDHATAGGAPDWRAESELHTFGLDPDKSTQGLSGGEIRRAALARAFAEEPDLLLLDEPTNHLDIAAIETLEARVRAAGCAVLTVSHDRAFLEHVTGRCFWLTGRRVRTLDKGFADFDAWSAEVEAQEAERARRLDKQIEREAYTFGRSITARRSRNEGRARLLADLRAKKSALMKDRVGALEMAVDAGGASGRRVAEVKAISKTWDAPGGPKTVVADFSTRIVRGDRVAVVGPNGAGKTTLVKMLLGETPPDAGSVKLGTNLEVAYLDQSRAALTDSDTLWEALAPLGGDSLVVHGQPRHVAAYARDFRFTEAQLRQPVSTLSGGERNRLLLARALARPANLLVLDEPTNDLDMETLDLLEDMLADYEGTLILVSHDRDFIDRLATSTIALDGRGRAVETPGGWSDFVRQNPGFLEGRTPQSAARTAPPPAREVAAKPAGGGKAPRPRLSFKDQHRLGELERLTADLPARIAADERALADPGLYARDPARFAALSAAIDSARARLAAAEEAWLELEAQREALATG